MAFGRDRRLHEIEALYRGRFTHFLRVALAIVGDRERALEAVQDAFADVVRSRHTFRGEGPLEAWVWRAVVNRALGALPRASSEPWTDDARESANGHHDLEASELGRVIALLPERQRHAVFLRYYADLDYRSIAAALGVDVGTVSATLSAAHTALRKVLKEVPR